MRLRSEFMPRDGGADLHLASDGKPRVWMVARWMQAENRITGYVGQLTGGEIANVRPVDFTSPAIQENTVGTLAHWMLISAASLEAREVGIQRRRSAVEQVSIWEDFLGRPPGKAEGRADQPAKAGGGHEIDLATDQVAWLAGQGLVTVREGGVITARRSSDLKSGVLISGFDALKIQNAIAETFGDIPRVSLAHPDQAREALRAVARPSSRAVAWYATGTGDQGRDRLQAARSFPLLAGMIADNPGLARIVEAREPLQPAIMDRTGLGKGALKRLAQISAPLPVGRLFQVGEAVRGEDALGVNRLRRFTVSGEVSLDTILRHLADLPPDRVPQDNASMRIFHDVLAGCAIPLENGLGIPVRSTLSACKGDWVAFHASLAKSADFEPENFDRRAIALTTIDAMEAIEDFSRSAVMPLALSSIASTGEIIPEVSNEFFVAGLGVGSRIFLGEAKNITASLFEMARRYSSRIPSLMAASGYTETVAIHREGRFATYGTDSFPQLAGDFQASNGLVIRQLDTHAKMRRESEQLLHCVGRLYLTKAYKADCHIFSVQSADGSRSLSTIEISATRGDNLDAVLAGYSVIQHRARNNATPSEDSARAADEWFRSLKSGRIPLNWQDILSWKRFLLEGAEVPRTPAVSWTGVLGTDWTNADVRQAVWEEWRYIAGGSFGKSPSPEVIFRDKGARDLVGMMNPKAASILMERARQPRPTGPVAVPVPAEEAMPAP